MTTSEKHSLSVLMVADCLAASKIMKGSPTHIVKTYRAMQDQGITINLMQVDARHTPVIKDVRYSCNILDAFWKIPQVLRSVRPDVLHCHEHKAALLLLPFAKTMDIPIVCENHGLYSISQFGVRGGKPFLSLLSGLCEMFVYRHVNHIIAQAETMKLRIMRDAGVEGNCISVIYPGVKTEEFSNFKNGAIPVPGVAPADKVIMYIGSTAPYQGLDLLAQVQKHFQALGGTAKFVLILSVGTATETIKKFHFDEAATIAFAPQSNAVIPAYAQKADILIHARPDMPDNINVQSKLGLYLAAGKPIVTTNIGDYPHILGQYEGCMMCSPDASTMASILLKALNDSKIPKAAATQGPLLAQKYFDAKKNIKKIIDIYENMLKSRRKVPAGA